MTIATGLGAQNIRDGLTLFWETGSCLFLNYLQIHATNTRLLKDRLATSSRLNSLKAMALVWAVVFFFWHRQKVS
jgi:hypothetical protein